MSKTAIRNILRKHLDLNQVNTKELEEDLSKLRLLPKEKCDVECDVLLEHLNIVHNNVMGANFNSIKERIETLNTISKIRKLCTK